VCGDGSVGEGEGGAACNLEVPDWCRVDGSLEGSVDFLCVDLSGEHWLQKVRTGTLYVLQSDIDGVITGGLPDSRKIMPP